MNSKDHSESLFSHTNEAGALSYLVVNSELWFEYSDKLNKALFTRSEYKTIFGALSRLAKKTTAWDLTGIIAEIENDQKREQIDWQDLLTYLSAKTETIAAFPGHLNVLIELKQKRDCIEAAESLIYDIKNNKSSALDAIVKLPSKLCNIIQADENTNNWVLLSDLKQDKNSQMICKGLPTGYRKLDDLTNGLKPGQITIIAGRPALGKSALAHFIVVYLALHKKRNIAIFSLDIDTSTLKIRLWSLVSEIPYKIIENNQLNDEEKTKLEKAIEKISKSKIYINDEVPMDIDKLKASAYQKNSEIKLDLIVVDHIQLIDSDNQYRGKNRNEELTYISKQLKFLARKLNVPILVLSQLSRDSEKNEYYGREPQLSDLRESGALEQDASVVLMLYQKNQANKEKNNNFANKIKIAKNQGKTAKFDLEFNPECMKFKKITIEKGVEKL